MTTTSPTITDDVIDVATAAAKSAAPALITGNWLVAVISGGLAAVEELLGILRSHPSPTLQQTVAVDGLAAAHVVLTAAQTAQAAPGATNESVLAAAQAAVVPAVVDAAEAAVPAVLGAAMKGSGPVVKSNGTGSVKGKDLDRAEAAAKAAEQSPG